MVSFLVVFIKIVNDLVLATKLWHCKAFVHLRQVLKVTKLLSSPTKTIPVNLGNHPRNEVLVELYLAHLHLRMF